MKFVIGQRIKHGPAYPMNCWERFPTVWDENFNAVGRNPVPEPMFLSGESVVVGLRMAIMGDYKYTPAKTRGGLEYCETVPAYSSGKREECLVCVGDIKRFRPYLVRKKDVLTE